MIRWFARNDIAANFLLVAILFGGIFTSLYKVPLEVQPAYQFDSIIVTMNYRGGTAEDVVKAIIIPMEESLQDLPGIKSIDASANRGSGRLWVTAKDGVDLRELLEEMKSRIDRITTFPNETERPRIDIPDSNRWHEVITVAVTGELGEEDLRRAAERVRDDLIELPGISQAELKGVRPFEISIEADQEKLRSFGLGFSEIADAVRRTSVDLSAGTIQSSSGKLVVRTVGQAYTREEFEKVPIRAANGAEVLLSEVATVKDGFEEDGQIVRFNGEPALMVEVMRHDLESAIDISERVQDYVANAPNRFPAGIRLFTWDDESISIRGRLGTLFWSLVQGCVLVFIILGVFLRPALAFWVVIGIPVSFAGGILLMPVFGVTANLMSLFGFIIVLGLVVDDAIVTGENIYSHLKTGINPLEASVLGTKEVAVPVTFGVITTIVAFVPLLFIPGMWGSFANQIPPVVAPVLLFSLIESKLILPSHLKHLKTGRKKIGLFGRFQKSIADGLETFVEKIYRPSLGFALKQRYAVGAAFLCIALLMAGYWRGGHLGFVSMPSVDRLRISADIDFPTDTPLERTDVYVKRIAAAAEQLKTEFIDNSTGRSLIRNIYTETGDGNWGSTEIDATRGGISVEILPPSQRGEIGPRNSVIAARWKEIVGPIPEAYRFNIRAESSGGRRGFDQEDEPIEIELRGSNSEEKVEIAHQIVDLLESYDGISDAFTRIGGGEDELEISLTSRGVELGLDQRALAMQIRQAFFGEEAQRVQRGRDDLRVMVRLTQQERQSLQTLETLKIQTPAGFAVSLSNIAEVKMVKAPGRIERIDGAEVIEIKAVPVDTEVDITGIAESAAPEIQKLINKGENLSFRYTGFIKENAESTGILIFYAIALLLTLYALLAIPFKSLIQPVFVMLAVPFGIIGALLGHIIMGITPSFLSIFGMLALAGVVVNDSLVMVDFINRQREKGVALGQAILDAGSKRFRPIMLTSVTTFAGLMPLIFDNSIQAQFLIPMAVSLGFGILFATAITLYLIPSAYLITEDLRRGLSAFWKWYKKPFGAAEPQAEKS